MTGFSQPTKQPATLAAAWEHHRHGRLSMAESMYRAILQRQPGNADALRLLGNVLRRTGRAGEALALLEKAVRIKGNVADNQMELGSVAAAAGRMEVAVAALTRAIALKPTLVDAYGRLAHIYMSAFNAAAACRVLEDGLQHGPEDARLHKAAGDAWLTRGVPERAIGHYERVLQLQPQVGAMAHADLGSALRVLGRLDEAMAHFDAALAAQPNNPRALAGKAEVFETQGRTEDAMQLIEPALRTGQTHPDLALTYARLTKRTKRYDDGLIVVKRVANAPAIPTPFRAMAHMAAGELEEAAGRFDEAFTSYCQGNRMYATGFDEGGYARVIDQLLASFSSDLTDPLARSGNHSELPVFILGMPRSGTSLVEQILSSHPAVFGAGELTEIPNLAVSLPERVARIRDTDLAPIEPFPQCVRQLDSAVLDALAENHLTQLQALSPSSRFITDKLPNNYLYLGLIWMLFPNARIIHCTRDPVETCFSCFATRLSPVHAYANDLLHTAVAYRQYRRVMEHWRQTLTGLHMIEVPYEQMVDDSETWTRALLEFCDLPWDDACLKFYESSRVTRTASVDQVRQPIYRSSLKRSDKFGPCLDPLREALKDFL